MISPSPSGATFPPMSTRFSVIIPAYNRARFIAEALKSVLEQSLPPYEVIVVDDGSTDNTAEVVQQYGPAVTYLRQENAGAGAARNCGISHSSGEWVAFLDSDDTWLPLYLEKQSEQIDRYPKAVAHQTNAKILHPTGTSEDLYAVYKYLAHFKGRPSMLIDRPLATIVRHTLTYFQTTVARREDLLQAGLFAAEFRFGGEDLHLMARLALLGSFGGTSAPLVHVHRRVEDIPNLSALGRLRGIDTQVSYVRIYGDLLALPGLNREETALLDRTFSEALRSLGNLRMRVGEVPEGRRCFRRAFLADRSAKSVVKLLASYAPARIWKHFDRQASNVIP
jgi:glycosyltransferase involved in cell wall biosynthesis